MKCCFWFLAVVIVQVVGSLTLELETCNATQLRETGLGFPNFGLLQPWCLQTFAGVNSLYGIPLPPGYISNKKIIFPGDRNDCVRLLRCLRSSLAIRNGFPCAVSLQACCSSPLGSHLVLRMPGACLPPVYHTSLCKRRMGRSDYWSSGHKASWGLCLWNSGLCLRQHPVLGITR